jgi:uncharacterized protein (TIGR02594 family)
MDQPKWLHEAWRELGERERPGSADNARILNLYRDAGHRGVVHDEVPWCAAFVGACLERAGLNGSRSLRARSYSDWGEGLAEGRLGAVVVLSRGGDPALGHVGFLVGETDGTLVLLGGNQADAVSVAEFDKTRLVSMRWPAAAERDAGMRPADDPAGEAFERALAHVLEMEGGYSDDPYDPGGPTNKGILLREYAEWRGVTLDTLNTDTMKRELQRIPTETVRAIYLERYWRPASCAEMPAALAMMHFDAAVNHGIGAAIRMLQQAVGTDVDGEIGPLTRAAVAQSPLAKTLAVYAEIRRRRYRALPHFWRFGRGWLRRVDATLRCSRELLAVVPGASAPESDEQQPKGDDEMARETKLVEPKWWGESLTIWGVIVTALSTVVPVLGPAIGVDITGDVVRQLGDQVVTTFQAAGGIIGTLMSVYGRFRASQPLERREMSIRL